MSGEACLTEKASFSSAAAPPLRGGASEDFLTATERQSLSAHRAVQPHKRSEEEECNCTPTPYASVEDLIRRVPEINKREIRALSLAGALNFDGTVHRREALWQSELAVQPAGPLFENAEGGTRNAESALPPLEGNGDSSEPTEDGTSNSAFRTPHSAFKKMEGLELVDADLRKTGISIGKHPMAFIREEMTEQGILSAWQCRNLRPGQIVSVAGACIIRQRPMTANNVVFITLEDETGFANLVVMPDLFERFRAVINQSNFLVARGRFEERGLLKAISFKPLDDLRTEVVSHDFR
jgi:error-prone DNA polymerase